MKYQPSSMKHFTGTTIAFPPTVIKILTVQTENFVSFLSSLLQNLPENKQPQGNKRGQKLNFDGVTELKKWLNNQLHLARRFHIISITFDIHRSPFCLLFLGSQWRLSFTFHMCKSKHLRIIEFQIVSWEIQQNFTKDPKHSEVITKVIKALIPIFLVHDRNLIQKQLMSPTFDIKRCYYEFYHFPEIGRWRHWIIPLSQSVPIYFDKLIYFDAW